MNDDPAHPATHHLNIALKEWDLTISALLAGRQAILLRKGGILEAENQFVLEHQRFLFFPTFIHQDPRMVKPAFRADIRPVAVEPNEVEIRGYGEAAAIFEVPDRNAMNRLSDLHLWDEPLIDMRFAYRPEKPLYLVVVRAFVLPRPIVLQNTPAYSGCRSWVPLEEMIDISAAGPALPPEKLQSIMNQVRAAFA